MRNNGDFTMAEESNAAQKNKLKCGIIMPISAMEDCTEGHWREVLSILKDIAVEADLDADIVSEAEAAGVIHKAIVRNVFFSDIVICDVSCRNPNVMFELGMRLTFDKPTVIVKDDRTPYSFDTGIIEHVPYPRDLRFPRIVEFRSKLKAKLMATLDAAKQDNYSVFLKQFGDFVVPTIDAKPVSTEKYILAALEAIDSKLRKIDGEHQHPVKSSKPRVDFMVVLNGKKLDCERVRSLIMGSPSHVSATDLTQIGDTSFQIGGSLRYDVSKIEFINHLNNSAAIHGVEVLNVQFG